MWAKSNKFNKEMLYMRWIKYTYLYLENILEIIRYGRFPDFTPHAGGSKQ